MYKYTETDENAVSLHDCRASGLSYGTGYIAFTFSEGIYVMENCVHNHNKKLSYTGEAEMRFTGFTWKDIEWNITIYIFTETEDDKKQIREEITLSSLTDMINGGAELEFISSYKGYRSYAFECWLMQKTEPHHRECVFIVSADETAFGWNDIYAEQD